MAATAGCRSSSCCLPVSASLQPRTLIMRSENVFTFSWAEVQPLCDVYVVLSIVKS